jgi:uncharacterized membrane protein
MDLSPTHIHLLLNHFPTVGFIIGICLFIAALIARSDHLKQASLVLFVGIAMLTIPAYVTGNAAQARIQDNPGVSKMLIDMHEGAALWSLLLMVITGGFAWLGLWQYRRQLHLPRWNTGVILVLSLLTFAAVSRAAALGGEIQHPEIRVTQDVEAEQFGRLIGRLISESPFVWVGLETLHFVGLSLLIGVTLLINLRALGIVKQVSYSAIDRLLPWAVLGFGLNIITGMGFFVAAHGQYTDNIAFLWKLIFVLVAGANTLYFFFDHGWALPPGEDSPPATRFAAASALVLWLGVLYWGSMLPFIGNAF